MMTKKRIATAFSLSTVNHQLSPGIHLKISSKEGLTIYIAGERSNEAFTLHITLSTSNKQLAMALK
jgi:hypothetical protein